MSELNVALQCRITNLFGSDSFCKLKALDELKNNLDPSEVPQVRAALTILCNFTKYNDNKVTAQARDFLNILDATSPSLPNTSKNEGISA